MHRGVTTRNMPRLAHTLADFPVFSAFQDVQGLKTKTPVTATSRCSAHCSFAYSDLASFKIGMSGSASFQSVKKSL